MSDLQPRTDRKWLNALLLAATLATTTLTGACHWLSFESDFQAVDPQLTLGAVANGLWYSLTILAILGAHELGHYLACRYYGINASLPYFLPIPFPLTGTAGAFIRIRQPITTKRALFDIGIAGPLAGFVVAVPALVIGMVMSRVVGGPSDFAGVSLGEPLLFKAVSWLIWGTPPETASINMHPMAFAAWFGLLATALNLIPIGQFDGGHIAYATLGRHAHKVTLVAVVFAVGLSVYSSSWVVWTLLAVGLLFAFGWRHPAVWDEAEPLDPSRRWLALLALVILVLCFTPAPIEPLDLLQPK
ncbi:MAG: site-2 protease family protein [Acidobacteria bacterium]|nr:site-2 protease family protein [Acidobacteriota bacterium]